MGGRRKQQIITFKADETLLEALAGLPNRSEFIREAVEAALEGVCPVCNGRGTLNPAQRRHWLDFAEQHRVEECDECQERHLVCRAPAVEALPEADDEGCR